MNKIVFARIWYGIIAGAVFLVIPTRMILSWGDETGEFAQPWARSVNVLCYFTNQSNILVGVVSLMLAINFLRSSYKFIIAELTGLVCVIVAGTIYYIMLASEDDLHGLELICNFVVHSIVPIMFTFGWLFLRSHGLVRARTIYFSLIFPIGWAIFAMIRGEIINYYPYPFMDVRDLGYATTLTNMAAVTVFFVVMFFAARFIDNLLGDKTVQSS